MTSLYGPSGPSPFGGLAFPDYDGKGARPVCADPLPAAWDRAPFGCRHPLTDPPPFPPGHTPTGHGAGCECGWVRPDRADAGLNRTGAAWERHLHDVGPTEAASAWLYLARRHVRRQHADAIDRAADD